MKKILVVMRETFPTNDIFTEKNLKEKRILNPYDEYALFQGKKVIGKVGGEVTCIFLSERKSKYGLRTALGLGADNGIFIYCPNRSEKELGIILAKEIKKENYDSIFIGIRDVNDDREELPYILGTELGIPVYSHLLLIDNKNNIIIAKREKEETIDTIKIHKKGIFAFSQNVYEPQYPTIESIMTINQKNIKDIFYEEKEKTEDIKIKYQDVHRKQEIYKKITLEKGSEKIISYMKEWKIIN